MLGATDKTAYARSIGYEGAKPVLVLDGRVLGRRGQDWFSFCATVRRAARRRNRMQRGRGV